MSRSHLLAYFRSTYSEDDVSALFGVVKKLGAERTWVSGPPEFVEHALVGIAFGVNTNTEHIGEPLRFIDALSNFSRTHAIDFEFEVDDEHVGIIENGVVENSIAHGLLHAFDAAA